MSSLRETLTDKMLMELADAARLAGDGIMVLRCQHALVDDLARQDVAIEIVRSASTEGDTPK